MHPRYKRGRVEWGKAVFLFIALQTQILCIRVANADEWSGVKRYFYLLRCKRKFYASALQTRTSGKSGILLIALQTRMSGVFLVNAFKTLMSGGLNNKSRLAMATGIL
ncbi:MAG TPA: hypothetical protein PK809_05400 [Bacteroidia bacterium]|nr:hypothetical protein [Bacteroidia bacterium]